VAIDDERVPRGDWRDTRLWRYVAGLVVKILCVREKKFVFNKFLNFKPVKRT